MLSGHLFDGVWKGTEAMTVGLVNVMHIWTQADEDLLDFKDTNHQFAKRPLTSADIELQ